MWTKLSSVYFMCFTLLSDFYDIFRKDEPHFFLNSLCINLNPIFKSFNSKYDFDNVNFKHLFKSDI